MSDSSVLASTLILGVGPAKLHHRQPKFHKSKINKPYENNIFYNIYQAVCQKQFLILFYWEILK